MPKSQNRKMDILDKLFKHIDEVRKQQRKQQANSNSVIENTDKLMDKLNTVTNRHFLSSSARSESTINWWLPECELHETPQLTLDKIRSRIRNMQRTARHLNNTILHGIPVRIDESLPSNTIRIIDSTGIVYEYRLEEEADDVQVKNRHKQKSK